MNHLYFLPSTFLVIYHTWNYFPSCLSASLLAIPLLPPPCLLPLPFPSTSHFLDYKPRWFVVTIGSGSKGHMPGGIAWRSDCLRFVKLLNGLSQSGALRHPRHGSPSTEIRHMRVVFASDFARLIKDSSGINDITQCTRVTMHPFSAKLFNIKSKKVIPSH